MANYYEDISLLKEKIEQLRGKLNQMTHDKEDCIIDEETIKLSQELDNLLIMFIKKTSEEK